MCHLIITSHSNDIWQFLVVRNHTSSVGSVSRRKSHQRVMRDYKFVIARYLSGVCRSEWPSQLIVTTEEISFFRLLRLAFINQINWFVCFLRSPYSPDRWLKQWNVTQQASSERCWFSASPPIDYRLTKNHLSNVSSGHGCLICN